MTVLGFAAAAAVASLMRWWTGWLLPAPLGTLGVNLAGAFALGLLEGADTVSGTVFGVAALGSLTTFSTLVVEIHEIARTDRRRAGGYAAATLVGGVALAWLGLRLG